MARMFSRKKGKSGSRKPYRAEAPKWVEKNAKDVEQLVVELAKTGKTPAMIGLVLRDQYGIPDVKKLAKKSISAIMNENKLVPKVPSDLNSLILKLEQTKKHFAVHKKDMDAKRGMQLTTSKIHRLSKYYKREGVLSKDWKHE